MKNYIGISRDHSASMGGIGRFAAKDYNVQIEAIHEAATQFKADTIVSVVKCGVGHRGQVQRESVFSSSSVLVPLNENNYDTSGSSTPLWDSIGELITIMQAAPDAQDPDVSFVVMVITDGEENSSRTWSSTALIRKINELQNTGRWTFTFRVPRGHANRLIQFGVPRGNILEWEQSEAGIKRSTDVTKEAVTKFYDDRSKGLKSSSSFYTTDLSGVSARTLQAKLTDVSNEVQFWNVNSDAQIRPFVEGKLGHSMVKGGAFYQLMKKEDEVQDYKMICIRDKKTGAVYTGVEARNVLGLPHTGTVKVAPGVHGMYDIFIQSTSVNRRLVAGTQVMYWERVGQPYQTVAPVKKSAPAPKSVQGMQSTWPAAVMKTAGPSADYIRGYKDGFPAGKAKHLTNVSTANDYGKGHAAGYKDGRGKQKRLYK